jgi:hypothetical protein
VEILPYYLRLPPREELLDEEPELLLELPTEERDEELPLLLKLLLELEERLLEERLLEPTELLPLEEEEPERVDVEELERLDEEPVPMRTEVPLLPLDPEELPGVRVTLELPRPLVAEPREPEVLVPVEILPRTGVVPRSVEPFRLPLRSSLRSADASTRPPRSPAILTEGVPEGRAEEFVMAVPGRVEEPPVLALEPPLMVEPPATGLIVAPRSLVRPPPKRSL